MNTQYDAFLGIISSGEMLSLSSAKFASPLGLNVLGTKVKQSFPNVFVRIYNLEINDFQIVKKDIKRVVKNHRRIIIGLTLIAGNVLKSFELAKWLKELGCDVIIGGPEINELSANHFSTLPIVDGIIIGFGEHIIAEIVRDGLKQKVYTTPQYFDFQNSAVDYSLLFRIKDYGGVSMLWGGDCHLCNKRCYFCSRKKSGFGWRNPQIVWEELRYAYQKGIKKIYNTADTVAVSLGQLRQLAETKPLELAEMKIKCFINATQVTDETAELLKQLNAWAAVGIESLARVAAVGKGGTTMEDNFRAIKILAQHGVPMILTFVMGLPKETKESIEADAKEILRIVREYRDSIYWVTVSPLLVTLGSQAFEDSLTQNLPTRHEWEFYNPFLLTEQYFKKFCSVKIDTVYKTIAYLKDKISEIAPEIIFDSKGLDPKRWK